MTTTATFASVIFSLVPLFVGAMAVYTIVKGFRRLRTTNRLAERGVRTVGTVISSHKHIHRDSDGVTGTELVETIEFQPRTGNVVRGNPVYSDVGILDRSGQQVTVLHDPNNPGEFIAPKDGERMAPGRAFAMMAVGLMVGTIAVLFVVLGASFVGDLPMFK